jgi:hypothetical protein
MAKYLDQTDVIYPGFARNDANETLVQAHQKIDATKVVEAASFGRSTVPDRRFNRAPGHDGQSEPCPEADILAVARY